MNGDQPRILVITRNLPPLVGGMERLNWHMAAELAKVADVCVIGPAGSAARAPDNVIIREVPLKPLWKFLWCARSMARQKARAWQPDIVLAGSGLTAPIAQSVAKLCAAKAVVYVHGLDVAVNNPVYRALWFRAIRRMHRVIANSHPTAQLCRDIGVDDDRIGIVHPGVDLPDLAPRNPSSPRTRGSSAFDDETTTQADRASTFRSRHNLGNRPLLLSVGRLSERKGLQEFVTQSLPQIVASKPDVMLLVVGDTPSQALHARAQTPASIQSVADAADVGNNIKFLGVIRDYGELGSVYCAANVHVFPVRSLPGDPEGFGMVAVEAAAHGLPTVAFATGGIADAVAEGQSGHLVAPGDYVALADAVLETLEAGASQAASCKAFAQQFAWPAFGRQVTEQLRRVRAAD